MAQTGYTPILIYSSSTVSQAPSASNLTNSTLGSELAINITDGKLFYKDNANAVQVIGWKTVPTTAGGTGLTSYTAGDLVYYASGTAFTKLAIGASGRWLGSSGTAPQWNAPGALTKTDDTNVTLTLGGSASTALLNAASLTLGWTGQLAVTRGGTGLSTVAQGDILYGSAANTLAVLSKNTTATRYLSNTGTTNNPAWAQVNLSNGVTGTLPTANGGTNLTTFTANGVVYASSTSALATGSILGFDGTNLLLNTASSIATTWFSIYGASSSKNGIAVQNSADTGTIYSIFFRNSVNTLIGSITNDGSNTAFNTSSDYRLKENVKSMVGALKKVLALKPCTFTWKSTGKDGQGFIAHELAEVVPDAVVGEKDAIEEDGSIKPQGIDTSFLVATLTAAIQEQQAIIENLQNKLKAAGIQGFE
jgi:hypothetical protein